MKVRIVSSCYQTNCRFNIQYSTVNFWSNGIANIYWTERCLNRLEFNIVEDKKKSTRNVFVQSWNLYGYSAHWKKKQKMPKGHPNLLKMTDNTMAKQILLTLTAYVFERLCHTTKTVVFVLPLLVWTHTNMRSSCLCIWESDRIIISINMYIFFHTQVIHISISRKSHSLKCQNRFALLVV